MEVKRIRLPLPIYRRVEARFDRKASPAMHLDSCKQNILNRIPPKETISNTGFYLALGAFCE